MICKCPVGWDPQCPVHKRNCGHEVDEMTLGLDGETFCRKCRQPVSLDGFAPPADPGTDAERWPCGHEKQGMAGMPRGHGCNGVLYQEPPADPGTVEKCGHKCIGWYGKPCLECGKIVERKPAAPDAPLDEAKKRAFFRDWKGVTLEDAKGFQDGWYKGYEAGLAAVESRDYSPFIERVRERTFRKCSHDYERCECYVEAMHEIRAEMGRKGE